MPGLLPIVHEWKQLPSLAPPSQLNRFKLSVGFFPTYFRPCYRSRPKIHPECELDKQKDLRNINFSYQKWVAWCRQRQVLARGKAGGLLRGAEENSSLNNLIALYWSLDGNLIRIRLNSKYKQTNLGDSLILLESRAFLLPLTFVSTYIQYLPITLSPSFTGNCQSLRLFNVAFLPLFLLWFRARCKK